MGFDLGALLRSGAAGAAGLSKGQQEAEDRKQAAQRQALSDALLRSQIGNQQSLATDRIARQRADEAAAARQVRQDEAKAVRDAAIESRAVAAEGRAQAGEGRATETAARAARGEAQSAALGRINRWFDINDDVAESNQTKITAAVTAGQEAPTGLPQGFPESIMAQVLRQENPDWAAGTAQGLIQQIKEDRAKRERAAQQGGGLIGRVAESVAGNEDLQTIMGGTDPTQATTQATMQGDPKSALLQMARERAQSVGADSSILNAALAEIQGMTPEQVQDQLSRISGR